MNKIISLLFCLLFLITAGQVQAKNDKDWMNSRYKDALSTMKLKYKLPKGFIGKDTLECFESAPQFKGTVTCVESQMYSTDKNFIVYFYIHENFTAADSAQIAKLFPTFKQYSVENYHVRHIENDLKTSMGDSYIAPVKRHIKYYPNDFVKKTLNADTLISYPLTIKRGLYLNDLYKNCKVLLIQKKGRGFIALYCFYNEVAAKNLDQYMKPVEEMFKYRD